MQYVTFTLSDEILAVPTSLLREILEPIAVTRVPQAGRFAAGLINVRGTVVPLVDLRVALRLEDRALDVNSRMLVLDLPIEGETTPVAIIAESVLDVLDIEDGVLTGVPEVGSRWPPEFVRGIARQPDGFVTLPDLDRIFAQASPGTAAVAQAS